MLSAYVLKTVAKPKQILLGDYRTTVIIFTIAGLGMFFTSSPVTAATIIGLLHPINVLLTRRDPFYADIFSKAYVPLVWSGVTEKLTSHKKESVDA
jgi:hypothetical protein